MKYRRLGRYGLKVSEVGLGSWLTFGRKVDSQHTERIVRTALDLGINFFDTADIYAKGAAESALGVALKGVRPEEIVVATKCFRPMGQTPNEGGLSRKHIIESVDNSLRRLGMDRIDLYQFHRFDPDTPVDESVRAVDDLIRQGKIHYWGVSEWSATQIERACAVARSLNCHPPVSNQPQYNLLSRSIEGEVMQACELEGMGIVCYSPMAEGVLTGKYKPGAEPPAGTRAADTDTAQFMTDYMTDDVLGRVQEVGKLASDAGVTLAQFALAWCLRRPAVSSVIVGATSAEQLKENAAASTVEISASLFAKAEEIVGASLN